MKTRVYYQVFSDSDTAIINYPTLVQARKFIDEYVLRLSPNATQDHFVYWTAYAETLKINKVIELTEQV